MTRRLASLSFDIGQSPTPAQTAALDLLNEMNAERRISTAELMVLLGGLVRLPVATPVATKELAAFFDLQAAGGSTAVRDDTTSWS